jgi:hypothetical protein
LAATYANGQVELDWLDSPEPNVASYNIYRSLTPNAGSPILTARASSSFTDPEVEQDQGYYYTVSAVDAGGNESPRSSEVFVSTVQPVIRPATPQGFSAFFDGSNVQLVWNAHADPEVVSYKLYRAPIANTPGTPLLAGLTGTSHPDTSVLLGASYFYSITAVNADGIESYRSAEILVVTLTESEEVDLNIPATDSAYTRAGTGVLDSSQWLGIKRSDFTGTARVAFLRFPLSRPGLLGGLDPENIESAALAIFVTQNEPTDTLRLYALLNGAQASIAHLSESSWTGGTNGTAAGGNNLQASNRPDGGGSLPNAYTTVELGSITFPGPAGGPINNSRGLQTIQISNMEAFRQILRNDTNGQITLILRGQLDREYNQIASTFNTNGQLVPTLLLTVPNSDDFEDGNENGIEDAWELTNFRRLLQANEIVHESGVPYYFMYLHGTDLDNPADRFRVTIEPSQDDPGMVFRWEVRERFILGTHYGIRISTDLTHWIPLPAEHYTLQQATEAGKTQLELTLTHNYGDRAFLRLVKP